MGSSLVAEEGYNLLFGYLSPMSIPPSRSTSDLDTSAAGERLESWKEVAAYLNRSVRTLHRWEKEEGLSKEPERSSLRGPMDPAHGCCRDARDR